MSDDEAIELGEPDELPMYNQAVNKIQTLEERIKVLEDALRDLVNSSITLDDKRLPDIEMQVDRRDLAIARAALEVKP